MDKVAVAVEYGRGQVVRDTWERVKDMHCPACGHQAVWRDDGPGDYYAGPTHGCIDCSQTWHISGPYAADAEDQQALDQIKAAHPLP